MPGIHGYAYFMPATTKILDYLNFSERRLVGIRFVFGYMKLFYSNI